MSDKTDANDTNKKPNHLDDLLFSDNAGQYYQGVAAGYIHEFLKATPINSKLAYVICHAVEDDRINQMSEFSRQFPAGKAAFLALKAEVDEQKAPLIEKQQSLSRQIQTLKGKKNAAEDNKGKLAKLVLESAKIAKQIAKIIDPVYKPRYPEINQKGNPADRSWAVDPEDWARISQFFAEESKKFSDAEPENYIKNLGMISKELGLSQDEIKILTFLAAGEVGGPLNEFIGFLQPDNQRQYNGIIARMLGMDAEKVSALFRPESHLMQYGLISHATDDDYDDFGSRTRRKIDGLPHITNYFGSVLSEPDITPAQIKEKLTGHNITTDLDWEKDFGGLGVDGQRTVQLLERAIEQRKNGSSVSGPTIFFHGEPDTGKTTAVAALIQHLKKKDPEIEIRVIGERGGTETGEDGDANPAQTKELTPKDRISQIKMALALGGKNHKTLFLVEEPNFLPRTSHADGRDDAVDRVVIQRLFENHGASALFFTTNHYPEIHPAVRRRISQAIEFKTPNAERRKEILVGLCEKNKIEMSEADINRLTSTYVISAGKWSSAVAKAVITAKPGEVTSEVEYWIQNQAKRDYGSVSAIKSPHKRPEHGYDLKLLNAVNPTIKLDELFERVKSLPAGEQRFRILLEGWSGTGKSEFVWHLADMMGKEVIAAKASDILDKYVGESEKNIAAYFEAAQERGAILLIDEVDSVLLNRKGAEKSWEVSLVNQFLTSLDQYEGMVACTTNNFDMIDPAAKRRFNNFIMGFDFLTQEQNAYAFKKFFKMDMPADYTPPENLTPSDYATVYDQAKFMGRLQDATFLTGQLDDSSKAKPKEDKPRNAEPPVFGFRHKIASRGRGQENAKALADHLDSSGKEKSEEDEPRNAEPSAFGFRQRVSTGRE